MSKTRILVVDDDPEIRSVFAQILDDAGYDVLQASKGRAGLQLAREKHPDLALLDVLLPDLNGMEVCKQIKADPGLRNIFVVLISGGATDVTHKVEGLESGADDYMVKPFDPGELLARLRTIVRLKDTNRTIELIDVLWLKGNSIVAAFEVECTTSVYSGLLRMSDLLALQPNLEINLFLVAPDERREKVKQEILRPTFSLKEKPLAAICGFLSFGKLTEKLEGIRRLSLASSLKPDFLLKTAEYFAAESTD
ncbi:MAG TPA: response regulator transcription factor [Verrucomicrobiae bacterium]|nr:response regulator transcription factor [Verrucomicrobiae bacterium]